LLQTQIWGELAEHNDIEISMSVVSNSPCLTPRENQVEASQFAEHLGEPMFASEQFLATSRTRYKVARDSLLSSSAHQPAIRRKRKLSVDVEADPIFQVFGAIENKPNRGFRGFLQYSSTKAREDDSSSGHEENKPSKSMFKMLKKGLSTPTAKIRGAHDYAPEDYCDSTTISSITRSVTSNLPPKPFEPKQSMPLGVLNGIFKAAKKLQSKKKRKTKSDSQRSLSKGPPDLPMMEVGAGKAFVMEPASHTNAMPLDCDNRVEPTLSKEREYGTYGKMLPMNAPKRTHRLGDAPSPAIYSLASW
jgi:hypothetical protein